MTPEPASIPEPSATAIAVAERLVGALRPLADPRFVGIEHVPESGPLLLAGNHTIFGLLDVPFMVVELHRRRGLVVRGLGDHQHERVPGWRELLHALGAVPGTRANCAALMRRGEPVLVFPGGGREVAKRRDERYTLVWKQRLGFARMAIENGCPVVPFAAVGIDDAYDVRIDADSPLAAPLRAALRAIGVPDELLWPLATGIGPTPIPRPQRLYFWFGEPIAAGRPRATVSERAARALRDETKRAVEGGIAELLALRSDDPRRRLVPRLLTRDR